MATKLSFYNRSLLFSLSELHGQKPGKFKLVVGQETSQQNGGKQSNSVDNRRTNFDRMISTKKISTKKCDKKNIRRNMIFTKKKKMFTKKLNVEYRNSSCNVDQRFVFEALEKCYNFFSSLFHNLSFLWRHDDLQKNAVIRGIVLLLSLPTIVGSASPPI